MAAAQMFGAPGPETTPASNAGGLGEAGAALAAASAELAVIESRAAASAEDFIYKRYSLVSLRGRCPAMCHGKMENGIVDRYVRFGSVELYFLPIGGAFWPRLLREWQVHSVDFLVVAVIRNRFVRHTVLDPAAQGADFKKVVGIEIDRKSVV